MKILFITSKAADAADFHVDAPALTPNSQDEKLTELESGRGILPDAWPGA